MNETPRANRPHIALFGCTNSGKSSLINALTNQELALVSDVKGTTTDPVFKSMEILPLGPVVLIDTAGLDDQSELGQIRIKRSLEILDKTDIVVLVVDAQIGLTALEEQFLSKVKEKKRPFLILFNKCDLIKDHTIDCPYPYILVSAKTRFNVDAVLSALGKMRPESDQKFKLVGDLVSAGDIVILVTPIDKAAPMGRLILPQQQVIRDLLESDVITMIVKEHELKDAIDSLNRKPKMVITDSQVFLKAAADTPRDILLTSFSILFARYKGDLEPFINGAQALDRLKSGDKILVLEGCTHHKSCDDIGTVKLPRWIRQYSGKELSFKSFSGHGFPSDISEYALILMCGSCMLTRQEVELRLTLASSSDIPIINYGMAIAHVQGILYRSLQCFPGIQSLLDKS
ncbi:MAG: small GTP-binding protein [Erysipelotrichaceae bacterium]|nr:MAG: small GTP-binding [Erysipelotrichaceae bacterium]TXT17136.1 MAG: small GTP-binding protein [Erysipelotrichaceae bacterium]